MGLLIDGVWRDQWYDTSKSGGRFVRSTAGFRNWVTPDGSAGPTGKGGFRAEPGRYHLYIARACPWAHRTMIFRALKGLEGIIDYSVVHWRMLENGWTFEPSPGVTGDLLAHCLDTAIWLNGSIASLTAMTETFVKERKDAVTGAMRPVGIDDASAVLTRFANGSLGTFESTRYARGHKAAYTLEINGENGSLAWDLHDLNRVSWFDHRTPGQLRGWTSILVTDGEHPYLGKWWVPGLIIGYEHSFVHQVADFLDGLSSGKPAAPTFRDALETTRVCDAIIASGKSGAWVELGAAG